MSEQAQDKDADNKINKAGFSSQDEIKQYLAFFLVTTIADMEIDGACEEVAINVKNNPVSENTLRLIAIFDWIRDTEFGDGSLSKILEDDGLIVMDSDDEAKEFLLGLRDQISKDKNMPLGLDLVKVSLRNLK